ncbi:MAG: hypothetical protein WD607_03160 [Candidatus Paceibacterota bacterium]
MNRHLKQILYGFFYFLIIFLIIYIGFYRPTLERVASCFDNTQNQNEEGIDCGGPCIPCGEINLSPVNVSDNIQIFFVEPRALSVVANISNKNSNYDASFYYEVNLFNERNELIKSYPGDEYIYSSDSKYIIINDSIDRKPIRAEVVIDNNDVDWIENFTKEIPELELENINISFSEDNRRIIASGEVINNSSYSNINADVYLFLKNRFGFNVFSVKSQVLGIQSLSKESFEVPVPAYDELIESVDFERSEIIVSSDD